jgi:hypothetical protein
MLNEMGNIVANTTLDAPAPLTADAVIKVGRKGVSRRSHGVLKALPDGKPSGGARSSMFQRNSL